MTDWLWLNDYRDDLCFAYIPFCVKHKQVFLERTEASSSITLMYSELMFYPPNAPRKDAGSSVELDS